MKQKILQTGIITFPDSEFNEECINNGPQLITDTGQHFKVVTVMTMRKFIEKNSTYSFIKHGLFKNIFPN